MPGKLLYAVLYFLLIPVFASVYYFVLSNDFYHSTVQFEYSPMNKTANRILEGLQRSITERIRSTQDGTKCGPWQLLPDTLLVHSLGGREGKVSFSISGRLVTNSIGHAEYYFSNRFSLTLDQRIVSGPPSGPVTVGYFPTSEEPAAFKSPTGEIDLAACLFPRGQNFTVAPLEIPSSLMDDIGAFAAAIHGFPSHVEGQFPRMLYFSATTITTLGFGDIVPLTTAARMIVSLESVLGILLMGLFLNALSTEKDRRPVERGHAGDLARV